MPQTNGITMRLLRAKLVEMVVFPVPAILFVIHAKLIDISLLVHATLIVLKTSMNPLQGPLRFVNHVTEDVNNVLILYTQLVQNVTLDLYSKLIHLV